MIICPICNKNIDQPSNVVDAYSYYQCCKGFFVKISNETQKFVELYFYQKPVIVYFSHVANFAPHWNVQINVDSWGLDKKIVYKEDGYLSIEEAKRQMRRYKNLLVFS